MIEVGLIGFGLAGRAFHAPVIRAVPGKQLAALLQRTGNEAAEKYPDVRIVRNLDELLAIREIQLVVIATPNDTHYSFARQCLAAGRDVVVDKPFTTTVEEAESLVQFAKENGRLITVYQRLGLLYSGGRVSGAVRKRKWPADYGVPESAGHFLLRTAPET